MLYAHEQISDCARQMINISHPCEILLAKILAAQDCVVLGASSKLFQAEGVKALMIVTHVLSVEQ